MSIHDEEVPGCLICLLVVFGFCWVVILPTIGLLWCIGLI